VATSRITACVADANIDRLVPDSAVRQELGVTLMTLWRYTHDRNLKFPPPIKIRNRNFRSRLLLEAFKARMLRLAIEARNGKAA
jgi:predicted DNA-binding transcriptional regulator AlpA